MDERQIINHCQLGDLSSFEELFNTYKHKALGTAYLISGSKSIAEDIVQEAFIICYFKLKSLKNPDVFNIWFYRILVRVGWRMAQKNKSHVSIDDKNCELLLEDNSRIDTMDDRLLIREAVEKLSPTLRTTVILFYFNEISIKQIARILNCFEGTVKSRLHKARKLLEMELKSSFEDGLNFRIEGKELNQNG